MTAHDGDRRVGEVDAEAAQAGVRTQEREQRVAHAAPRLQQQKLSGGSILTDVVAAGAFTHERTDGALHLRDVSLLGSVSLLVFGSAALRAARAGIQHWPLSRQVVPILKEAVRVATVEKIPIFGGVLLVATGPVGGHDSASAVGRVALLRDDFDGDGLRGVCHQIDGWHDARAAPPPLLVPPSRSRPCR